MRRPTVATRALFTDGRRRRQLSSGRIAPLTGATKMPGHNASAGVGRIGSSGASSIGGGSSSVPSAIASWAESTQAQRLYPRPPSHAHEVQESGLRRSQQRWRRRRLGDHHSHGQGRSPTEAASKSTAAPGDGDGNGDDYLLLLWQSGVDALGNAMLG